MSNVAGARAWPSPGSIWLYYERSKVALSALRMKAVMDSLTAGSGPFVGLTITEYEDVLSDMRNELDSQVTMALVASFEASFRSDFDYRSRRRSKDTVNREFRNLARTYGFRVRFEDLLEVWRRHLSAPQDFGYMMQLLKYRHWLAHGRYWVHKAGREFDPDDAWQIGVKIWGRLPQGFPRQ